MPAVVYSLCALTSIACAALLVRGYFRSRTPLLFWSCLSFVAFAINNILLVLDFVVLPNVDLAFLRTLFGALAGVLLVFGLMKETLEGGHQYE